MKDIVTNVRIGNPQKTYSAPIKVTYTNKQSFQTPKQSFYIPTKNLSDVYKSQKK